MNSGDERYFIVFFRVSVSPFCFFYSRENACDLSRKRIRTQRFDLFMRSDREWSRQRDESLIDILTEFCPSLVFYLFYKEREKNVKRALTTKNSPLNDRNTKVEFFTGAGDIEAFGELFFDNLATMLGVTGSAIGHIGYGILAAPWRSWGPEGYALACAQQWEKIYYEWNIPACGLCLLFGNVYYAWLATRLATKENRTDVTAQPYGMNTTVIYIMLYAITLPALETGHDKFAPCIDFASRCSATDAEIQSGARKAAEYAWEVSVTANFIVGLFEVSGFFLGDLVRWLFPTAAVFIPLFGVGFMWLGYVYVVDIFEHPMMCWLPFMIVLTGFFGNVRYPIYKSVTFPIALLAILSSSAFGWMGACEQSTDDIVYGFGSHTTSVAAQYNGVDAATGLARKTCQGTDKALAKAAWKQYAGKGDIFGGFGKGLKGFTHSGVKDLVAQSLLYGAIGFLGSMADVESAEMAGDSYPMAECLIFDGLGTMIGALAGSIYGTTMYIGHPIHKALGAKIGYSLLNGVVYFVLFCSGIFASLYNVIPLCANGLFLSSSVSCSVDKRLRLLQRDTTRLYYWALCRLSRTKCLWNHKETTRTIWAFK